MVYNRICNTCGEKYYACANCVKINSWKNFCCSRECYREMIVKQEKTSPITLKGSVDMKTSLRAGLKNGRTITITGYDLELGKFDCSDETSKGFEDFEYFIVPVSEMKEISARLSEKIEHNKKNRKFTIEDKPIIEDMVTED